MATQQPIIRLKTSARPNQALDRITVITATTTETPAHIRKNSFPEYLPAPIISTTSPPSTTKATTTTTTTVPPSKYVISFIKLLIATLIKLNAAVLGYYTSIPT